MGPVPRGIELEGTRLAPDAVLGGFELDGRRLALRPILEDKREGLALDPGPTGAVPVEIGAGEADGVDCGATEVLFCGIDPYPSA